MRSFNCVALRRRHAAAGCCCRYHAMLPRCEILLCLRGLLSTLAHAARFAKVRQMMRTSGWRYGED